MRSLKQTLSRPVWEYNTRGGGGGTRHSAVPNDADSPGVPGPLTALQTPLLVRPHLEEEEGEDEVGREGGEVGRWELGRRGGEGEGKWKG